MLRNKHIRDKVVGGTSRNKPGAGREGKQSTNPRALDSHHVFHVVSG